MLKILIVEDDPAILDIYQKALSIEGYQVENAVDGEEGLAKALSIKPNLILLDIMLPKKDGVQVLEAIKKDDLAKNIPVLILSNFGQDEVITKCINLGAENYMIKAATAIDTLLEKVKEYAK